MNIFCYFTISRITIFVLKKKFELNGIRVIQRDDEELIRQTLLGIEKSLSKDYFELSLI